MSGGAPMVAKRRMLPKLVEPPYDFKDVPSAKRDLEGSVVASPSASNGSRC